MQFINNNIVNKSVSIIVSGGADSALLLYFLLKQQKTTTHIITLTNKQKFYRNLNPAVNVVNFCVNESDNNNVTHKIIYSDYQDQKSFKAMINQVTTNKVIIGFTDLPPDDILEKPDLPAEDMRLLPKPRPLWKKNIYAPFVNINKAEIANIYSEHNLTNTLFPLTMSCESLNSVSGHCGECWWCRERQWAFGKLD